MTRTFTTNPVYIDDMLQNVQRGELALPEFQRDFVWTPDETAALLVSMIHAYPAGSLLLWSPGQAEVAARAFAGAPKLYSANPRLVLDGQQRLTSLYQAFFGVGDHRYFVNLSALLDEHPAPDDAIIWKTAEDVAAQGLDRDRRQFQELLVPLERLRAGFQGFSTWRHERLRHPMTASDEGGGSDFDFRLTTIGDTWVRALSDYQFPVVELTREADIDAVCHIFEKVNSTGQKLSMFELLTARFWAKGIKLRDLWDSAQKTRGGIIASFKIDPVEMLRVVVLLAEIPDPGRPAAIFKLSADQINRHWNDAVRGMAWALELLQAEFGVVDQQWLPYAPMLTPLAAIEAGRPPEAGPEKGGRLKRLHCWYWCSIFSGAYVQGAARRAVADYFALKRWLDDPFQAQPPEAVETFPGFWPGRLRELSRKGQAEYKACVGIILRRTPRDLDSGEPLVDARLPGKQLLRRFLFPKPLLHEQGVSRSLQDSILNTTMTRPGGKRGANKMWPSAWLQDSQRVFGPKLPDVLSEHLLPRQEESPLWRDDFGRFLEARTQLLAHEIAALTGVPCRDDEQYVVSHKEAIGAASD